MIQIKEDLFLIYPFETLEGVDKCRICVVLKKKKLVIIGKDLTLDFYSPTEIVGKGRIEAVQFLKR